MRECHWARSILGLWGNHLSKCRQKSGTISVLEFRKFLIAAKRRGTRRCFSILERSGYREETYHTFSYSPLSGGDGKVAGHLCVVTEETERIIGERRISTLRSLAAEL